MAATRVQYADNGGADPVSATLAATPTEGNLLVAVVAERSGTPYTNASMTSGGATWALAGGVDESLADSTERFSFAVFYKIAGASEPATVSADNGTANLKWLNVSEYNAGTNKAFEYVNIATNSDTGPAQNGSLSTGTLTTYSGSDFLAHLAAIWKQEGGNDLATISTVNGESAQGFFSTGSNQMHSGWDYVLDTTPILSDTWSWTSNDGAQRGVGTSIVAFRIVDEGPGGVTGNFDATETGADTAAFAGTVTPLPTRSSDLAATETGSDGAAFAGSVTPLGATADLDATETGADSAAFSGAVTPFPTLSSDLAATETGADSAALSGSTTQTECGGAFSNGFSNGFAIGFCASLDATETGADSAAFAGSVTPLGAIADLDATETGADSAAFSGAVTPLPTRSSDLAATETGADSAAFAGVVVPVGGSTLDATETGADGAAFSGAVTPFPTRSSDLAATEAGADTAAFAGTVAGLPTRDSDLAAIEAGADSAAFAGSVVAFPTLSSALDATETGADTAAFRETQSFVANLAAVESGADVASMGGLWLPIPDDSAEAMIDRLYATFGESAVFVTPTGAAQIVTVIVDVDADSQPDAEVQVRRPIYFVNLRTSEVAIVARGSRVETRSQRFEVDGSEPINEYEHRIYARL